MTKIFLIGGERNGETIVWKDDSPPPCIQLISKLGTLWNPRDPFVESIRLLNYKATGNSYNGMVEYAAF